MREYERKQEADEIAEEQKRKEASDLPCLDGPALDDQCSAKSLPAFARVNGVAFYLARKDFRYAHCDPSGTRFFELDLQGPFPS